MVTQTDDSVTVQAIVPASIADQLKSRARIERRSISSLIRNSIEDSLRTEKLTTKPTESADSP